MECPICGFFNPDENKFCTECGLELKATVKVPNKKLDANINKYLEIYGENYKEYLPFFVRYLAEEKILSKKNGFGDVKFVNYLYGTGLDFDYDKFDKLIQEKIKEREFDIFEFDLLNANVKKNNQFIDIKEIDKLNGYEFEKFLNLLFKKMGYIVVNTPLSGDQGADLIITKFGSKTVVQAKRHKDKISNRAVQEIAAAIPQYQADKGVIVSNSEYTKSAKELANSNNISLINRDKLKIIMKKHPIKKNELSHNNIN